MTLFVWRVVVGDQLGDIAPYQSSRRSATVACDGHATWIANPSSELDKRLAGRRGEYPLSWHLPTVVCRFRDRFLHTPSFPSCRLACALIPASFLPRRLPRH